MDKKSRFGTISEIVACEENTWNKIFLSFDMDWACDEVLADSITLVEEADIDVTWFVTHDTPLLSRIRCNPKFELGIHPNFNFLMEGDPRNGRNTEEVIDRMLAIVPEAKSVRSHSLLQSERLVSIFAAKGLTHVSNFFIPLDRGINLKPWQLWNGITAVPHCWQDNVSCMIDTVIQPPVLMDKGIKVLNFHPIHVFLNTDRSDRYESTRKVHHDPAELVKYRFEGEATRSYLMKVMRSY